MKTVKLNRSSNVRGLPIAAKRNNNSGVNTPHDLQSLTIIQLKNARLAVAQAQETARKTGHAFFTSEIAQSVKQLDAMIYSWQEWQKSEAKAKKA